MEGAQDLPLPCERLKHPEALGSAEETEKVSFSSVSTSDQSTSSHVRTAMFSSLTPTTGLLNDAAAEDEKEDTKPAREDLRLFLPPPKPPLPRDQPEAKTAFLGRACESDGRHLSAPDVGRYKDAIAGSTSTSAAQLSSCDHQKTGSVQNAPTTASPGDCEAGYGCGHNAENGCYRSDQALTAAEIPYNLNKGSTHVPPRACNQHIYMHFPPPRSIRSSRGQAMMCGLSSSCSRSPAFPSVGHPASCFYNDEPPSPRVGFSPSALARLISSRAGPSPFKLEQPQSAVPLERGGGNPTSTGTNTAPGRPRATSQSRVKEIN